MIGEDILGWFEVATVVRIIETPYVGRDSRTLFRCKVCCALIEGPFQAAHRYWHLGNDRESWRPES